jgi:hypothetical protein
MPVSFTNATNADPQFLTPAPFINITKDFDKQGDGEILGARYSITLSGTMVADRGSPIGISATAENEGTFLTTAADALQEQSSGVPIPDTRWYESLQIKQKALSNLISKLHEGAYLEVTSPGDIGGGFSAFVKFDSLDLPGHAPGQPYLSEYTINLTADYLIGPDGDVAEDDFENQGLWLVSGASENWDISEIDKKVYDWQNARATGDETLQKPLSNRTLYQLTRNVSATGKSKFIRTNTKADGLTANDLGGTNDPSSDTRKFNQKYAPNGKAWQQARGFVYDVIKYGDDFITGKDGIAYNTTENDSYACYDRVGNRLYNAGGEGRVPSTSAHNETTCDEVGGFWRRKQKPVKPTGDSSSAVDADDPHLFGINLPNPITHGADHQYVGFDYKRTQSVDVRSGTFSVTETWILAPANSQATESISFDFSEDEQGVVQCTVNGTIEGLYRTQGRDSSITDPPPLAMNYSVGTIDGTYNGPEGSENSKLIAAEVRYNSIQALMYQTVYNEMSRMIDLSGLSVNPQPVSKSVAKQPDTGIITYSMSYNTRTINFIPFVKTEDISLNDTYPGYVAAQHQVLGRRTGPVLQSIGTQTEWRRDLTISCTVDTHRPNLCIDSQKEVHPITNQAACIATSDPYSGYLQWVDNPNSMVSATSANRQMSQARPSAGIGALGTNFPAGLNGDQRAAVVALINSFSPQNMGLFGVRKFYTDAPTESWNPKTGQWSYSVSWVYELKDPYAFPTTDYVNGAHNDNLDSPYPGVII